MEKIDKLFSIKARSSKDNLHISGGERIVRKEEIEDVSLELLKKVNRNSPDFISLKIEEIKEKPIVIEQTLPIEEYKFKNHYEANEFALKILQKETGIDLNRLKELINLVHNGASPDGNNMRGAMIVNQNGERIEIDKYRGVRTTYVDFFDRKKALAKLLQSGFTERTADAILIATKNLYYKDFIAEYCISDEPDYITGYIAVKNKYIRITPLKKLENNKGGRIFFVRNNINLKDFYNYLEKTPVLIKEIKI